MSNNSEESKNQSSEHTKNKRKSTKGKHEKGQNRKLKARSGVKGHKNRPNRRPPIWRGPWP